ncbi:hypothetical protein B0H14DRAFT_3124606 [Mycena olivaceomarginata]|nr:hypothetical protein B0H14DRAFT_3124606 [Mycena olivaceomarginata]
MAGIKRSAEDNLSPTRASKVAKTDEDNTSKGNNSDGINAKKTVPTTDVFKSKALPLHLTLTHTPPTVADADTVVASLDPGHLSDLSLVPTSFKTGSYGWKGNKRLTVELVGAEGGEVDRVTVVLTINAIVVGSKAANEEKEKKDGRPPTGEGIYNANNNSSRGDSCLVYISTTPEKESRDKCWFQKSKMNRLSGQLQSHCGLVPRYPAE